MSQEHQPNASDFEYAQAQLARQPWDRRWAPVVRSLSRTGEDENAVVDVVHRLATQLTKTFSSQTADQEQAFERWLTHLCNNCDALQQMLLDEFWGKWALRVAAVARRGGVPRSQIDDLVQEVRFAAYKRVIDGGYDNEGKFGSWLHRIATNRATSYVRSDSCRRVREQAKSEATAVIPEPHSEPQDANSEGSVDLSTLIQELLPGARESFITWLRVDKDTKRAARLLDIDAPNTLIKQCSRLQKALHRRAAIISIKSGRKVEAHLNLPKGHPRVGLAVCAATITCGETWGRYLCIVECQSIHTDDPPEGMWITNILSTKDGIQDPDVQEDRTTSKDWNALIRDARALSQGNRASFVVSEAANDCMNNAQRRRPAVLREADDHSEQTSASPKETATKTPTTKLLHACRAVVDRLNVLDDKRGLSMPRHRWLMDEEVDT